ncbi:MAG: hypothetical protein JNK12_14065 [Acidimicrobiales bacterium]|nr:hypothetical protein [Acidimicrobiales bacterium]
MSSWVNATMGFTCAQELELRSVGAEDADQLSEFPCRRFKQPWTDVVEELVRLQLGDALAAGNAKALGLWDGARLVAVAAWRMKASASGLVCSSILIAVRNDGASGKGCATRLKDHLVDIAIDDGCVAVASEVHRDNDAMLRINEKLGAHMEWSTPDGSYLACVVPLRRLL